MKKLLMFMIAGTMVFGACKKDDEKDGGTTTTDSTKPVAAISSPADGSSIKAGDNIVVTAKVTDETKLKSYTLKLMSGSTALRDTTIAVSGKEAAVNMTMNTDGLSGAVTVSLFATDAAGNVSATVSSSVTVQAGDTEKPKVNSVKVTIPTNGKLNSGFDNRVTVDVSDNEALDYIVIEIFNLNSGTAVSIGKTKIVNSKITDPKSYKGEEIVKTANLGGGVLNWDAEVTVTAYDKAGNTGTQTLKTVIEF